MRCEWIDKRENIIALGPSGVGKTHTALALGLAACQKSMSVLFIHGRPRFAKLSVDDSEKVKIAAIHPDFV
jgi:DNA replication protein DnaC